MQDFQDNYIGSSDATMHLDPGDDRAITGLVRVHGDLQVDGTTTTVNSNNVTTLMIPSSLLVAILLLLVMTIKIVVLNSDITIIKQDLDSLDMMILTQTSEDTSEDSHFYTTPQILQRSLVEQRQV